jgi:hypothetical protein
MTSHFGRTLTSHKLDRISRTTLTRHRTATAMYTPRPTPMHDGSSTRTRIGIVTTTAARFVRHSHDAFRSVKNPPRPARACGTTLAFLSEAHLMILVV